MMNNIALSSVVKTIKRNTFGVLCVLSTEPRMRKTNNPYLGRVTKITRYVNVAVGRDYYVAVENAAERKGLDGKMVHEKASGMSWCDYPYFLVGDKNPNQFYLRLTLNKNTKIEATYKVDGRDATAKEVEEIKTFLYDKSYSQKQAAVGLTNEEDQVYPFSPKVENIVELSQGLIIYKR